MKAAVALVSMLLLAMAPSVAAGDEGKQVFEHYCQPCHGDSVEAPGTLQLARTRGADKRLLPGRRDLNAQYVELVVRHGLRTMPPFAPADLTDAKLRALIAYLGIPRTNEEQ